MKDNKIHVAYGFHVNCYHSYRGDTNDNLGFGSDIRIIRNILDTLTEFNEKGGIIIANARQVLNSMAHCPMRLEKDKSVHMNPFGTYYGNQRHHFGRAKDQILNVYTLVASQGKSIAPSYNGSTETAVLGIYPLSADGLTEKEKTEICAFADGAVTASAKESDIQPFSGDNITVREGTADGINEKDLKNPL